ncbi:hypothetical protein I4U23_031441 [Adineta vaga]|nr:hypothetical protein I4U23_031441 [Adineta vaga]
MTTSSVVSSTAERTTESSKIETDDKIHGTLDGGIPFDDFLDHKMTPCIGVEAFWHLDHLSIQFFITSGRSNRVYGSEKGEMLTESYEGFTIDYAKGRSGVLLDQLQIVCNNQVNHQTQCSALPESSSLVILSAIYQIEIYSLSKSVDVTDAFRTQCGKANGTQVMAVVNRDRY